MSRYIDADKFKRNLKTDKYGNTDVNEVGKAIGKSIVDVVEVRHGHWIYIDKVRPECPDDSDCYYECSECHAGDAHNKRVQVPYCWHCGAKMDGEEE